MTAPQIPPRPPDALADRYPLLVALAAAHLRHRCPHLHGPPLDPRDVANSVALQLLEHPDTLAELIGDRDRFAAYAGAMVRHFVTSEVRRDSCHSRALGRLSAPEPVSVSARATARADGALLRDAIGALPAGRARAVAELVLQGKTVRDIADDMHIEPNAVNQAKHRAVRALRALFGLNK